ncbi:hypothetical protein ABBQ38_011773 [Trebouxia sp. C0009 RCD-2024]
MVELARGISAKGRSKSYKKRGLHFIKEKNGGKFPQHAKKEKAAEAPAKASKFYPAGRFKGKRCVFLKQLDSGLLLVTGPFKVNGVPLRRVNQAYVIATSTQVEISKVDVSKFDDAYFKSSDKAQKKKGEEAFFEEKTEKKKLSSDYIDNQKKVDAALLSSLKPDIKGYLSARFSLKKNDRPHLMAF